METQAEHRYHPSFGHYLFIQEKRAEHYPLPNPLAFTSAPPVFSAFQANFSFTPQVPSGTLFSPIKWPPSLPPPEKLWQLLPSNNLFSPQTNPVVAPGANYQGEINNCAVGWGNRSCGSGKRNTNRKRRRVRKVGNMALDPSNEPSVTPDPGANNKKRPGKKVWGWAMNAQENLCLICEYCEYSSEYKPWNKLVFWKMIRKILRDQTNYDLKEPRNTVFCRVADWREELVLEKMGFGIQVDQNDFKTVVKQFAGQIKEVNEELEFQVKFSQAKAIELFESACLQSAMVFGLDDESISRVEALSNTPSATEIYAFSVSIALNPLACSTANKQKHEQAADKIDPN